MDQDELSMHDRERCCLLLRRAHPARRVLAQRPSLKLPHQPWYLCGGCKHELPFGDIHASVFAGPLVDLSEPKLVHPTDVSGRWSTATSSISCCVAASNASDSFR